MVIVKSSAQSVRKTYQVSKQLDFQLLTFEAQHSCLSCRYILHQHIVINSNPLAMIIQPSLYQPKAFRSIYLQFRDEDTLKNHVKGLAQVLADDISCTFVH